MSRLVACSLALSLTGCTVVDLATVPVRGAGKVVDAGSTVVDVVTVSQSERDQKRGREVRRREERLGKLDREYHRQSERCSRGYVDACRKREATWYEMQRLMPSVPYEPS